MTRIILAAAVATLGFAGAAAAQQAPVLTGDYSANVLNAYNMSTVAGLDFSGSASIGGGVSTTGVDAQHNLIWNDNYSGK